MQARKQVVIFIASAVGLYLSWYFLFDFWLKPDGRLDHWLTVNVAEASSTLLGWMGFDAHVEQRSHIYIGSKSVVWIDHPCNGLELYVLFAGFILVYPGGWKNKLPFILSGVFCIYLLNIIRVALLAINYHISRQSFHFNHKYLFTTVVYVAIFGLWMLWVNKFSGNPQNPKSLTADLTDASL
ncbi:MAG: exosortase family protein XrtF [Bacteroidota bacterium]